MHPEVKSFYRAKLSKESQIFAAVLVSFGLMSSVILPSLPLGGLSVYLVTFISPVVLSMVFLSWIKLPIAHFSVIFPVLLGLMVFVSSLVSWATGFSDVNSRDLVESIKYVQFIPYLLFLPLLTHRSIHVFHRIILLGSLLVVIVGGVQKLGLSHALTYLYLGSDSVHLDSALSGYRITLTGSDPNIAGVISAFFCVYYFSLYAVKKKILFFFISLVFFYFCFMTQSRTALIALIFSLGVYYFVFYDSNIVLKFFVFIISFSLVVFLVFYLDLSYIYVGIQYALEGENNSLNVRFENLALAVQRFYSSPFFGVGPAKSSLGTIIDSEYALIIQRYGLVGVLIFIFYIIYLFRLSIRNIDSAWGVSLFVFVLMSVLVMVTNNIFSGYQLMSIVVYLNIACVLNEKKKHVFIKESTC